VDDLQRPQGGRLRGASHRPRVCLETYAPFFFTLVTGPKRSLSRKLSDTRVYEPQIRSTALHRELGMLVCAAAPGTGHASNDRKVTVSEEPPTDLGYVCNPPSERYSPRASRSFLLLCTPHNLASLGALRAQIPTPLEWWRRSKPGGGPSSTTARLPSPKSLPSFCFITLQPRVE